MNLSGFLVLDKPAGLTSRAALDRAARWFPRGTKIGHAGTLDPLATGVLVLAIGPATRLVEYVQAMPKTYRAEIVLGATSDTDDADGLVTPKADLRPVAEADIRMAIDRFVGAIEQVPPAYSAAHVGGRRAHQMARRGEAVELAVRSVRVDAITVRAFDWPRLELAIDCGKGTYIRSIARDLGLALGCGGYVSALRRLRIGAFAADDAVSLDSAPEVARAAVRPLTAALDGMPRWTIGEADGERLRNGQPIATACAGPVAAFALDGRLIAIAEGRDGLLWPEKVFRND